MSKRSTLVLGFIVSLSLSLFGGVCFASSKPPAESSLKIEMISIPKGSFLMGNSGVGDDKKYSNSSELPQHSVFLSAYSIGKYEVTRGQYKQFIKAGGYSNKSYWSNEGWNWNGEQKRTEPANWADKQTWVDRKPFTQTDNHPIVGVTYYEAEAFCKWAGGHLPTEAQWERAARWNSKTKHANVYPWGDIWDAEKCNNFEDHNSAGGGYQSCQTAPAGSYPSGASPSGCQDMAGNVREWCKDWYGDDYYSKSPSNDPQGPANGSSRVVRDGGWNYGNNGNLCSRRHLDNPYSSYGRYGGFGFGFRLCRSGG